jgi:hypothetical protein
MVVNDTAPSLDERGVLKPIASKLAPTEFESHQPGFFAG